MASNSLSVPYVILPSTHDTSMEEINTITAYCNAAVMLDNQEGTWCVGSSHGWLVLLDKLGCPFLQNPSSSTFIDMPPFSPEFIHRANGQSYYYYLQTLREIFVSKAVLKNSPSPSQYTVAIMYSYPCKIAFCNNNTTWTELELFGAKRFYSDIVFSNNNLYALTEDGYVEGWDFHHNVPRKILDVKPSMERDEEEEERCFPRDKFSRQIYLVISKGELLLVKRFIGNFVNGDGEVVYEGWGLDNEGEICPYMTKHFSVYKLCLVKNMWEKVKSLNDQVVFIGANESTSVDAKGSSSSSSSCIANSIYFTDDRWEEMNLDYEYGGHDWGIFSLQDKTIKLLTPYTQKMDLPPIWVLPTQLTTDHSTMAFDNF